MILFNGQPADFIPAWDRGLHYGDGVFRTLKVKSGQPCAWGDQYAKLERDCAALALDCPPEKQLLQEIRAASSDLGDCALKIIISRGVGQRGYAMPGRAVPSRMLFASPLPDYPASRWEEGIILRLCQTRYGHQPRLAGIKHLNRLENVLARSEWEDPAIAEGLMLDLDDQIISGTMSNVFLIRDGALFTPSLDQCGIAGVQRERIIRAAHHLGITLNIDRIKLNSIDKFHGGFVCNSLIGLWPVARVNDLDWPVSNLVRDIQAWLDRHG
jgi:4-amino-4-deoxychorismate lyase